MNHLFFYTRKVAEDKTYTDCFNLNKVIRAVQMEDDRVLVLLDDLHERSEPVPDIDPRTGKQKGMKRERHTYQTEITLTGADINRFLNLQFND